MTKQKLEITKHAASESPGRAAGNLAVIKKAQQPKDSTLGQDSLLAMQQMLRTCLEKTNAFFPPTSGLQQRAPYYKPDILLPMWAPSVIKDSCVGREKDFQKKSEKARD